METMTIIKDIMKNLQLLLLYYICDLIERRIIKLENPAKAKINLTMRGNGV